jgi:hypothetical protein
MATSMPWSMMSGVVRGTGPADALAEALALAEAEALGAGVEAEGGTKFTTVDEPPASWAQGVPG